MKECGEALSERARSFQKEHLQVAESEEDDGQTIRVDPIHEEIKMHFPDLMAYESSQFDPLDKHHIAQAANVSVKTVTNCFPGSGKTGDMLPDPSERGKGSSGHKWLWRKVRDWVLRRRRRQARVKRPS